MNDWLVLISRYSKEDTSKKQLKLWEEREAALGEFEAESKFGEEVGECQENDMTLVVPVEWKIE